MKQFLCATLFLAVAMQNSTRANAATSEDGDAITSNSYVDEAASSATSSAELDQPATEPPTQMASPVQADGERSSWDVSFTPYIWAAGMSGDVGIPRLGQSVTVDRSFSDTLSDLEFAFMGTLDARHDRLVILADMMYLDLGAEAEEIAGITFISGQVDTTMVIGTAAIGYRVIDQGPLFVDLFAGARVVSLDVDLGLSAPGQSFRAGASPTDVSTLFGARLRVPLGERWAFGVYGDVGSFLEDSDVKLQIMGSVQYTIDSRWTAVAGYRHLSIDHKSSNLDFDVDLSGPLLGVTYRF